MIPQEVITISRHIIEQQRKFPEARGEFSGLLSDLTLAAKLITRDVRKAGLVNILGLTGSQNIHGERVTKLDDYANHVLYEIMTRSGQLCVMASEEAHEILPIPDGYPCGKYVLLVDPLDGSSNIDANITIGTIFSVHKRITPDSSPGTEEDCLQPGYKQVCAGYVVYGSSTMLVYTTGQGVHGFTYDPTCGDFLLSNENIHIPEKGKDYSINEGNYQSWTPGMKRFIDYLKETDKASGRPYGLRYVGSLVADVHRTLLYGGIFLYPGSVKKPEGKLRLLYEASPIAMIMEQAQGKATNGKQRILDIQPAQLHERTPLILGSPHEVDLCHKF
ncbi:MAG TPA: class 1 fructose-bisphosphatase, partial [Acidobacteriota bacterium]